MDWDWNKIQLGPYTSMILWPYIIYLQKKNIKKERKRKVRNELQMEFVKWQSESCGSVHDDCLSFARRNCLELGHIETEIQMISE